MRVHYDNIVFSLQRAGGISTYWSELITRLLRDEYDVTFEELKHHNIVRPTLAIKPSQIRLSAAKYLLLERFRPVNLFEQNTPFIFHSSYNRVINNIQARQVTTVHDFVHEKFYKGIRKGLHLMQKNKVLKVADRIITVSENTKRDLMYFHPGISENRIKVIYNGVSEDFYPLDQATVQDLQKSFERPYLVYIGSREAYKNFNFSLKLLRDMPDFDLYIVGSALDKKELNNLSKYIPGRWKHFTHIDNKRLNELYNTAFALIYPSSYEGFGIPLLEAMKAGTPFLALNNSALNEVVGNQELLLEKCDVGLFKEAIDHISLNREDLVQHGIKQASKFSWEKCYQETLSVYKELS